MAVDFGTSNTAAAWRPTGETAARPVRLSDQAEQMPSAVASYRGEWLVGSSALGVRLMAADAFVESPKRHVGEDPLWLDGRQVEASEMIAEVYRHVLSRALRVAGGGAPVEVVLTHPEEWADRRTSVLRAAWESVGPATSTVRLVSEPVAAATWYAHHTDLRDGAVLAVLDMGGGTCDVAVMRHRAGAGAPGDAAGTRVEVLSFGGIDDLGGVLLDRMMGDHVEQVLVRRGRAELLEALADPRRLRDRRTFADAVRTAKYQPSDWSWAEVPVVVGEHDDVVMLTESDFGSLVADPVRRAVALLEQGVLEAGLTPDRLDAVYLTGGSSHLRPLQVAVDDLIGMAHSSREDPELVVALGALETTDQTQVEPSQGTATGAGGCDTADGSAPDI